MNIVLQWVFGVGKLIQAQGQNHLMSNACLKICPRIAVRRPMVYLYRSTLDFELNCLQQSPIL